MRGQPNRDRNCLAVFITRSDQTWDTDRQRSGLVEHHRVDFGKTLQAPPSLTMMPFSKSCRAATT